MSMESSTTSAKRPITSPVGMRTRYQSSLAATTKSYFRTRYDGNSGGLFAGVALDLLFDRHVAEFAGFEDLAALQALDELSIFLAGDDLHAWMGAWLGAGGFAGISFFVG